MPCRGRVALCPPPITRGSGWWPAEPPSLPRTRVVYYGSSLHTRSLLPRDAVRGHNFQGLHRWRFATRTIQYTVTSKSYEQARASSAGNPRRDDSCRQSPPPSRRNKPLRQGRRGRGGGFLAPWRWRPAAVYGENLQQGVLALRRAGRECMSARRRRRHHDAKAQPTPRGVGSALEPSRTF